MSDIEDTTKRPAGWLERINRKTASVTAMITAMTLLIGAVITFQEKFVDFLGSLKGEDPSARCLSTEVLFPQQVSITEWNSMQPIIRGHSSCSEGLAVHLVLKARGTVTKVQIEAPFQQSGGCLVNNPQCWQQLVPEPGDFEILLIPPALVPLVVPFGEPQTIYLNWVLYETDTGRQIQTDSEVITLMDADGASSA